MNKLNDRNRVTIFMVALILALGAVLAWAIAANAGVWHQSVGRAEGAACEEGWTPSWAQWPNDGQGGWVCNREVDDPSVPVAAPSPSPTSTLPPWPSGRWLQYAGNVRAQSNPPGSGYTIVSSPFNACLWSQARTRTSPDVTVSDLSPNNWVELHNTGVAEVTGIVVEVLCD